MKLPKIDIVWVIVGFIIMFVVLKQCEGEPKTITKTETVTKIVKEPIVDVQIKEVPKTVYVEKKIKGDSIIIYKDKPSEIPNITETKQYETELKSNNATASLLITADKLYDVSGTITYPEKETTVETIKTLDASGFYIYGSMPISSQITTPELGVMFQIRNKIIIGVGAQYNNFNDNVSAVATLAVKL